MLAYQIDLMKANGSRDCLLAIACSRDMAAIMFAKAIFRINKANASRVVVWRGDEVIFEESSARWWH